VRAVAAQGLGPFRADPSVTQVLRDLVAGDPDDTVRAMAAESLAGPAADPQVDAAGDGARTRPDPAAGRVVYTPTAFGLQPGDFTATSFNLGHWALGAGALDWLEVTFQANVPVMAFQFGPGVKFTHHVSDKIHLGLWLNGQFFLPYTDEYKKARMLGVGVAPILTLGDADAHVNIAVLNYCLWIGEDLDAYWVVNPTVGGSLRVGRRVKLNLEVHVPLLGTEDGFDGDVNGRIWAVLYGVRIFGESVYGDIAFLFPFFEGFWEIMKYTPLGWPLLSFGFAW